MPRADYEQVGADFARQAAKPVTVRCVTKDGRTRWFSWTGAYDPEDDLMLYVGRDVTGDVEHRTEMERQSRTDSLTGLANRRHLGRGAARGSGLPRRARAARRASCCSTSTASRP